MKYHIYITSEGRIHYVKDMPFFTESHEDAVYFADLYEKDIQKVKDESIPFENPKLLEPEFVIDEDGVVMNKWPDGILRECAVDRFYTINMEENIEVVEEPELPGFDHTSYPTFRKVARIVAPKKEEESKDEFIAYIESLKNQSFEGWNEHAVSGYTTALLSLYQKYVEIKRKPL